MLVLAVRSKSRKAEHMLVEVRNNLVIAFRQGCRVTLETLWLLVVAPCQLLLLLFTRAPTQGRQRGFADQPGPVGQGFAFCFCVMFFGETRWVMCFGLAKGGKCW